MLERLRAELAGNLKPVTDYRAADPAQAFPMALEAIRNNGVFGTPNYQDQLNRADFEGADPDIVEFQYKFRRRLQSLGVPMYVHCCVRTFEQQLKEFEEGDSRVDPRKKPFPHRAYAVDLIHSKLAWDGLTAIPHAWELLGHVGKEVSISSGIPITWGGDFKSLPDPAHWELLDWKERYSKRFTQDHGAISESFPEESASFGYAPLSLSWIVTDDVKGTFKP